MTYTLKERLLSFAFLIGGLIVGCGIIILAGYFAYRAITGAYFGKGP